MSRQGGFNEAMDRALALGPMSPPACPATHADNLPGVYTDPKRGPCCAHCDADLGVPGPLSEGDDEVSRYVE